MATVTRMSSGYWPIQSSTSESDDRGQAAASASSVTLRS